MFGLSFWKGQVFYKVDILNRLVRCLRQVVRPTGVEPVASGTGIQRSIQLSYGRIFLHSIRDRTIQAVLYPISFNVF
jgi:hypothetical protein